MASAIPVRNVFAMLAFHWDGLGIGAAADAGTVEADTPQELLAEVLDLALHQLFRRGLARAYSARSHQGTIVRGALDLSHTLGRALLRLPEVSCTVDELEPDIPANRLIRAVVRSLLSVDDLASDVRRRLRAHLLRLSGVADVPASNLRHMNAAAPRGHHGYPLVLDICRFVIDHLLPTRDGSGSKFRDFTRDDAALARLFEGFVRGALRYYTRDRGIWVGRRDVSWFEATGSAQALALMPRMHTDVVVEYPDANQTIMECKFYREPFRVLDTPERIKLRSGHIYQLQSYLHNAAPGCHGALRGVLLYAGVGRGVDETVCLRGIPLRILTLDLTAAWPMLRQQLCSLI